MELFSGLIDFILHLDAHLTTLIGQYGAWTYAILFAIVFAETGLVVTPFLPGDSLLFAAGAMAAGGSLDPWFLFGLLSLAAIVGDSLNYAIGKSIGPRAFSGQSRFFKREHLERTHRFYEKHGGKTIVLARFLPIVRTFAPFVAGVGTMEYSKFFLYNVAGALLWNGLFISAGYFFGNLPFVKKNFELVIIAMILLSVVPIAVEAWKAKREGSRGARGDKQSAASEWRS